MKRIIVVSMFFLIVTSFLSLNAQWARIYGGESGDYANSIQQTSDGGLIVAGYTWSFSDSQGDFWVLKLTSSGDIEWEKTYGGSEAPYWFSSDIAYSIQQTSEGGYIVAGSNESFNTDPYDPRADFWVLKLTSSGDIEWQKTYGGDYGDTAYSIQQTSDGGYIVAGELMSTFVGHLTDLWILKLYSTGDIEWQKTYGGDYNYAYSIQQTIDGGYIIAGHYTSSGIWILKLYSTGDIEWQKTYGGSYAKSVQQTSDGGYIVAGNTNSFGAGEGDFWVLKLFSTGDIEWQKTYGGSDADRTQSIQQTSDGGYIVVGNTLSFGAGGKDIWVLKLSPTGDIEWEKTYGGSDSLARHDIGNSIQEKKEGGYIVAGYTDCFGGESSDFLILDLSPTGDIDPLCDIIGISNATVESTNISPVDTSVAPLDTNITPSDTNVSPQDSDAYIILPYGIPKYTFTISADTGGTTYPFPDTYEVYSGSKVRISAEPIPPYVFSYWTGDVPQGDEFRRNFTLTVDADKSIKAYFIRHYWLSLTAGEGGTTSPYPDTYTYEPGTSVSITALADTGYRFGYWSGNASGVSNPITITMDSDKSIKANFEAEGKKGPCFIATASYGTPLHPHIKTLRDFRDKYLMPSNLGQKLVDLYYKYSPFVADLIAKHKAFKVAVRIMLLPLVAFSYSILHFDPIIIGIMLAFIFMLSIVLISLFYRKLRRFQKKLPVPYFS
ncbi:hypothetical protein KA005_42825 [bacterium]|nr:hypothetical protein [bacterium]